MNISFVLAVYNKLDLTEKFYKQLRTVYPEAELIISSGGSTDGTKEWLTSLNDNHLHFIHSENKLTFSDNYNSGIKMVKTDKLVLVHNDMIIGESFLENLDELLTEDTLLSYTTIEPPIYNVHTRPGKVIMNLGSSFEDFNYDLFNSYVIEHKDNKTMYNGAVFFMSGYKSLFENVGFFDGFSFNPAFCEDDDFLLRAKLKGYKLKTTECAITYHFVSQTSRFGNDFKNQRDLWEGNSNKNFIRKWGIPNYIFQHIKFNEIIDFKYEKVIMGLTTDNENVLDHFEPFFDRIIFLGNPSTYIEKEQKNTNYNLKSKFEPGLVDVMVYTVDGKLLPSDYDVITKLRLVIPNYEPGKYDIGNLKLTILKPRQ